MTEWSRLLKYLEEVNWHQLSAVALSDVASVLAQTDPRAILERMHEVFTTEELWKAYIPHHEFPRPIMDKFVLFIEPQDRFRIRLHRFKTASENRGAQEWIHDHRWAFVSLVLSGSYYQEVFDVVEVDDSKDFARLQLSSSRVIATGLTNYALPRVPHLTKNLAPDVSCYTLFVRGPSVWDHSRIFDFHKCSFTRSWGLRRELYEQYLLAHKDIIGERKR